MSLSWADASPWLVRLLLLAGLLAAPLVVPDFRLNLLGKFVTFAIAALALDLIWGYSGMLSLGQGVFFGLGGYAMAMYLKLEASGGRLPDFMSWSGLNDLPWFWQPFRAAWFALPMTVLLPMSLAAILGAMIFRSRITGVYFSIITQALALIMGILFIGQQPYTGGTNGITNLTTLFGLPLKDANVQRGLYLASVSALALVYGLCYWLTNGRFGRLLVALRDDEHRVRFSGYDPARIKVIVFGLSAGLTGLAGALFVPQVGIISPAAMGIVPSIEMVIWVAVGGRGTLIGAVLGALIVNAAKSGLSESFPDIWQYFLGALFIGAVLLFPDGLVGFVRSRRHRTARATLVQPVDSVAAAAPHVIAEARQEQGRQAARPILSVEKVSVQFDGFTVLEDLDFSMGYGELRFLIGPNGAGKTTLLDVITGKTRPASGHVLFEGVDIRGAGEHTLVRRGIGRKFQTPAIFPRLSVAENIEVALGFREPLLGLLRPLAPGARDQLMYTLDVVGLMRKAAQPAGTLSHGEKQWLEIALLLVQEPKLLLLDEPVAGMTRGERERTGALLESISRQRSTLVIEHDMEFVRQFARTVTVLHAGKLLCEGTIGQVQADPRVIEAYLGHGRVRTAVVRG
jgi:urea transport system permease protein